MHRVATFEQKWANKEKRNCLVFTGGKRKKVVVGRMLRLREIVSTFFLRNIVMC